MIPVVRHTRNRAHTPFVLLLTIASPTRRCPGPKIPRSAENVGKCQLELAIRNGTSRSPHCQQSYHQDGKACRTATTRERTTTSQISWCTSHFRLLILRHHCQRPIGALLRVPGGLAGTVRSPLFPQYCSMGVVGVSVQQHPGIRIGARRGSTNQMSRSLKGLPGISSDPKMSSSKISTIKPDSGVQVDTWVASKISPNA